MLDISVVLFVRGKRPGKEVIELAKENSLTILASDYTMFKACGLLVMNGMEGLEIDD
jgi:predicted transcriptional regulator